MTVRRASSRLFCPAGFHWMYQRDLLAGHLRGLRRLERSLFHSVGMRPDARKLLEQRAPHFLELGPVSLRNRLCGRQLHGKEIPELAMFFNSEIQMRTCRQP